MMLEILLAIASLLVPTDHAELVFAGDAMQHQRQIDAARQPDGSLDYSPYFESLKPYIESADYAVVNLETPLGELRILVIRCSALTTIICPLSRMPDSTSCSRPTITSSTAGTKVCYAP